MLVKDTIRVAKAVVRVMGDSTKTHEIHRVEEITGRPRYRTLLRELADTPEGRRILEERPELSSDRVDYDRLRHLPATTLGGAYARHLDDNGITADYQAAATRHVDDPDMAYLMRRFRQTHDVWHALLGIGITGHEEVLIHWFSYGQLRLPVSVMIMLFGSVDPAATGLDWRLVKQTTEWRAPARYDDVLDVRVRTLRVGTTSFQLATEYRRFADQAHLAATETTCVMVDPSGAKRPIADAARAALERGAPGIVVDHAAALNRDRSSGRTP